MAIVGVFMPACTSPFVVHVRVGSSHIRQVPAEQCVNLETCLP